MELLQGEHSLGAASSSPIAGASLAYETALSATVLADLKAYGWKQNEAFRQVSVVPNGPPPKIPKRDMEKIIDLSTVEIAGYGGPAFPYRRTYSGAVEVHHADGFGIVDNHAWPWEDWSFHYWYFTEQGCFFTHRHLSEEHMANIPRGTLSIEWLRLDVARSLLFCRKLQTNVQDYPEARVKLQLHRMRGRELIVLNKREQPENNPIARQTQEHCPKPA